MHTPDQQLPCRLWDWKSEEEYAVVWHIINARNGLSLKTPEYLAQLVENLTLPSTHPFWTREVKKPVCAATGYDKNRSLLTQSQFIPHDESPIPGVAVWLRSNGVLDSDFTLAEERKWHFSNVLMLYHEIGDLMEYDVCGLLFPPTLNEMYALIELGEINLYNEAKDSRWWHLWKATGLATGWSKLVGPANGRVAVLECFMLWVHDDLDGKDYYPAPVRDDVRCSGDDQDGDDWIFSPEDVPIKKIHRKLAPGPGSTRLEDTLEFYPRLTEGHGKERKRMLPHQVSRLIRPLRTRANPRPTPQYDTSPECTPTLDQLYPKIVLPVEMVGHCMMAWKFLRRLLEAGWVFTPNLQKIYEAIEWYLVLGESSHPFHMWDCKHLRPTHIQSVFPSMPDNKERVYRPDLFDAKLHRKSQILHFDERCLARLEERKQREQQRKMNQRGSGHDTIHTDYDNFHGGQGESSGMSDGYASFSNTLSTDVPDKYVEIMQPSSIKYEMSDAQAGSSDDSTPQDFTTLLAKSMEAFLSKSISCDHSVCRSTLKEINELRLDLFNIEVTHFKEMTKEKGRQEAIKLMRYREPEEWISLTLRNLKIKEASVISLIEYCDGHCNIQAMAQGLNTPESTPLQRKQILDTVRRWASPMPSASTSDTRSGNHIK